jgi:hypothetical protein
MVGWPAGIVRVFHRGGKQPFHKVGGFAHHHLEWCWGPPGPPRPIRCGEYFAHTKVTTLGCHANFGLATNPFAHSLDGKHAGPRREVKDAMDRVLHQDQSVQG